MAMIECRSAQRGVKSVMVEVPGITGDQVNIFVQFTNSGKCH